MLFPVSLKSRSLVFIFIHVVMKRSATAAQLAYPQNWRNAQRRRVASRLNGIPIPVMQRKAIQQVALQTTKRYIARNTDKKATQDYSGLISVTTVGGIGDLLTNLVRGDNSLNEFSGSKIVPLMLTFNYLINFTPNEEELGSTYSSMRFMIVQDIGYNGQMTTVSEYMATSGIGGVPQLAVVNMENNENWRCLYDSGPMSTATNQGYVAGMGLTKTGSIKIYKKDLRTVFYGEGAQGTNVERNAIRCIFWSDSGASPNPSFQYNCQLDFTDDI